MKKLKKLIASILCAALLLGTLAGCGNNSNADPVTSDNRTDVTNPPQDGADNTNPTEIKEEDKFGGTIVIPGTDPMTLLYMIYGNNSIFNNLMNDVLLAVDIDTGEILYRVCESHEVSNDGLVYVFHIRDGVYWHDGVQLTAEDVVWSHDVWQEDDWMYKQSWVIPGKWEALDEMTVQVTLDQPRSDMLELITRYLVLQPKHAFEGIPYSEFFSCELALHPIGCGPFKFVEYAVGDYIKWEANQDFWNGRPYLDEVVMKVLGGGSEMEVAFETGQIAWTAALSPSYYNEIKNDTDRYNFYINPKGVTYYRLMLDGAYSHSSRLEDRAVREALAYMVDYDSIINKIFYGCAVKTNSPFANGVRGYADVSNYTFDLERANQILDDAGYVDTDGDGIRNIPENSVCNEMFWGQNLAVQLWYVGAGTPFEYLAVLIADAMNECGIAAIPYLLDQGNFLETYLTGDEADQEHIRETMNNAEIVFILTGGYGPFTSEYRYLLDPNIAQSCEGINNWDQLFPGIEQTNENYWETQFTGENLENIKKLAALFQEVYSFEGDEEAQMALYREIQDLYMNDLIGSIPICTDWYLRAYQKNVHYEDTMYDPRITTGWQMEKLWIE